MTLPGRRLRWPVSTGAGGWSAFRHWVVALGSGMRILAGRLATPSLVMPNPQIITLGDANRPGLTRTPLRGGTLEVFGRRKVGSAWAAAIDALPPREPGPVLVGRDPAGLLARVASALWPEAPVTAHHLDAWEAAIAAKNLGEGAAGVSIALTPDLPPGPFSLVVIPCPARAESLLSRELIEQAHDRLIPGGRLIVASDGPPTWLRKAVKEIFGSADLNRTERGMAVTARRSRDGSRSKDHGHAFSIDRNGRTLTFESRPGVFAPGRLDGGTKALLGAFSAKPGEAVLDIGCGVGVLGLAAAVDAGADRVVMVDGQVRATDLARRNADQNGLGGVQVVLSATHEDLPGGPFDRVLTNPPYFSDGRIADAFTQTAIRLMQPAGVLHLVAKAVDFHREVLERHFHQVVVDTSGEYGLFECRKPRTPSG